jgi:hypothetical protein
MQLMFAREDGQPFDPAALESQVGRAVDLEAYPGTKARMFSDKGRKHRNTPQLVAQRIARYAHRVAAIASEQFWG